MTYELTGDKKPKKSGINVISEMSTFRIILHLLNRHKTGLLITWAIIATALALAPSLVIGLIKSLI